MAKRMLFLLVLLIILFSTGACFNFRIESDVDFPAGRFAAAQERVSALVRHNPDRIGRSGNLHMLVYDGSSRELVCGDVPMWLVRLGIEKGEAHEEQRTQDVAGRYVDFDWQYVKEFSRLGPGLLVQVDDMDDNTHVLLWLE
jgi:hypothetical protein